MGKENCVEEKGGKLLSGLVFVRAQSFVCDRKSLWRRPWGTAEMGCLELAGFLM